jgi:3-methylcrotonyl-CoA carboxylase alpha subunit
VSSVDVRSGSAHFVVRLAADGAARIDDSSFRVEPAGDGIYRVSDGSRHWSVAVAGAGDECWIFVDGNVYQVEVGASGATRRRAGAAGHELSSPMPATVVRVLVEAGAQVARGDALVTLEAMKMELQIRAPRDGVVSAVHCKAGDLVPPGVNLLDLA